MLKRLCGDERLFLGMKAPDAEADVPVPEIPEPTGGEAEEAVPKPPKPLLWLIGVDRTGGIAAVEPALPGDEAAATYLYRVAGDPETFALILNRGMEATNFRREIFTLTDEELAKSGHLADAMLLRRTPALQVMRECFAGRVIHSGRWQQEISVSVRSSTPSRSTSLRIMARCTPSVAKRVKWQFCGIAISTGAGSSGVY